MEHPDLVFVHLSDIHFRKGRTGDIHDEDTELRNELERDLRRLRTQLPRVDGIVVSGDIAFGGKPDEYEYANGWLRSICEILDCKHDGVLVTPGNHDVDRDVVPANSPVDLLQQEIRKAESTEKYDDKLATILRDPRDGEVLLRPLDAYNAFAKGYGCNITRMRPFWQRDFLMSDGTTLRLWGLTTTLLSGPRDHAKTHRMMYGTAQRMILRKDNVRHAVMGHHPPSWTVEGDNAERVFSTLSILQLFGHLHTQWITRIENSVRVIAGAVQPARVSTVTDLDGVACWCGHAS